jgi:hypothetical protein
MPVLAPVGGGEMSFGRLLLIFAFVLGILFMLFLGGEWENELYNYVFTGALLLLAAFLMFTRSGGKKKRRRGKKPSGRKRAKSSDGESSEEEDDDGFELPAAVVQDEDGGSRRDRKLAQSAEANEESDDSEETEEVVQLDASAIEEEVHVAEEYVVDIDAESIEEADIEDFVDEQRDKRAAVKRRIEERRRGQLAEIRANAAKMWAKQDDSEDLLSILSKPGHGLTLLDEPEKVAPGHPYGATYVRIDNARILKLRIPLDDGFVAASEIEEEEELLDLPPPPDGLPLPPPPTASQSRLDAMRDEMV